MTARHAGVPGELFRLRANGWIVSLCLHGSIVFLTGLLVAKIGLAPQVPLFHWDVTVIGPHSPAPTLSTSPSYPAAVSKPIRPAQHKTPITSVHSTPSPASLPPTSAPASTTVTTHQSRAERVLSPQNQESQQDVERTSTALLSEPQKSTSDRNIQLSETSAPAEILTQPDSPLRTPVLPVAEAPPTSEPSSPSIPAQQTHENTATPDQVASLAPSTSTAPVARKPDYGWLADSLLHRIETLKQYPASARLNHLEGRVIVRIVIEEDGRIASIAIEKSSGHEVLDQAALDTLRRASPIAMSRPLEKSPVTMQIPLSYRLGQ